jgi:ATP:ADP antiporter, AAA family
MQRWFEKISGARAEERKGALWSFAYFFTLLAGYYVLRPIRDEMAIQVGRASLHKLFTIAFVCTLCIIPIFGWLNKTFPRRAMLPWLYGFFIVNVLIFYTLMATPGPMISGAFFVWVLVFNLFAISVFWSFMADIYDTEQAKRLYGFIGAGGTAGALLGPLLTSVLASIVGMRNLLLLAALFFCCATYAIVQLREWAQDGARTHAHAEAPGERPTTIWTGLVDVVRSPYLLGICLFLFLYSLLSTFLYFQQTEWLPKVVSNSAERVAMLAQMDFAVNVLTLLIQLFAFGALIRKLGIVVMLMVMPVLSVLGFAALATAPVLMVLVAFGVVRRAGEYAVSKPARETLFNVLPPAQKYTAKNVIDTMVHRGGDTLSSWIFTGLRGLGLSSVHLMWLAVPIAALWAAGAWKLGREAARRQAAQALQK